MGIQRTAKLALNLNDKTNACGFLLELPSDFKTGFSLLNEPAAKRKFLLFA